MKRFIAASALLGGVAGAVGLSAPAGAVPTNGETLVLECDVLGTVEIATNVGNGEWTPGFLKGSHVRLIPYAFRFQFGDEVFEVSKPAPANGRLDVCTFSVEDEGGTFNGTVWLSYTRGR